MTPNELDSHRAHDYAALVRRWKRIAKAARLSMTPFADADRFPLYVLRSPCLEADNGIYISAGIHGDEPGATEGLVSWAASRADELGRYPLLIFPCLNPWGLIQNRRSDSRGRDLNRAWDRTRDPLIRAVRRQIAGMHFDSAWTLHEDYDAQGLYVYEPLTRNKEHWGEKLLKAASPLIKLDPRRIIDGRKVTSPGLLRKRLHLRLFAEMGLPEAVFLHLYHSKRTFTIETPSEFALDVRVRAHRLVLDEAVRLSINS